MIKVAINGFGRIGRNVLRAWLENRELANKGLGDNPYSLLNIVAINDLGDPAMNAHLLKYDSVHGQLSHTIVAENDQLHIDDLSILCLQERNPADLPWAELGVDLVLECTGLFTSKEAASAHCHAGAKKVLISAPAKNADATVVYGVNHDILNKDHRIVSNASCTTNCLAPITQALHESLGIEKGLVTTVHAYTNDQRLSDVYHSDMMRARSATQSLIPTQTGAASAISLIIPDLSGKLDGLAVRVPVINVSLLDLTVDVGRKTSVDEVNSILIDYANQQKADNRFFEVNKLPLVSIDFNHNPASSIADINLTKVIDNQVKILAWYDNEWGFSNRMLDTSLSLAALM